MNESTLQAWIDEALATSRQQWTLRLVAVLAPLGAVLAATAENGRWWPVGLVLVTILASSSAVRPDSNLALIVITIVVWHWVASVDRLDSPWLPVAACCLLAHHTVTAVSATFPPGGEVPIGTLLHWLRRTALVALATVGMWTLVVVLDRRDAPGNGLLTGFALAIAACAFVGIRFRSISRPR